MRTWKESIERINFLIKKVSDAAGGDEPAFLAEYCLEIILKNKNNLDEVVACFEDLAKQIA